MIGTITHSTTKNGRSITVHAEGQWVFKTLDDCFGMDRVRDWAKKNRVVLAEPGKAA